MTMITGADNIAIVRLISIKGACKLEKIGLKHSSGRSMLALAKQELGLKRNTKPDAVIAALEARIAELTDALQN